MKEESNMFNLSTAILFIDVKTPFKKFFVDLGNCVGSNDRVWTLAMNTELDHEAHTPMVLLHGYMSFYFYFLNLLSLVMC